MYLRPPFYRLMTLICIYSQRCKLGKNITNSILETITTTLANKLIKKNYIKVEQISNNNLAISARRNLV